MKKILLFLCIMTLCASCTPQLLEDIPSISQLKKPVGKEPVLVVEAQLILHPIKNVATGNNKKNYNFFYDYNKRYLHVTDEDTVAKNIRDFLPEYITADSIGRGVNLQSAAISPFSTFTQSVKEKITQTKGIDFTTINLYQFAKSFNVDFVRNDTTAMESLLKMLTPSGARENFTSITPGRTPIYGVQGLLLHHPIKNVIKSIDGKEWYFFLDRTSHCIFITDDAILYQKIVAVLPLEAVNKNAVIMQGTTIEPIVFFSDSALTVMEKDQGLEINGGGSNNENKTMRNYDIAAVENCSMVIDYPGVMRTLRKKLGVEIQNTYSHDIPSQKNVDTIVTQQKAKFRRFSPPLPAKTFQDTVDKVINSPVLKNDLIKGNGRKPAPPPKQ